MPDLLRKRRFTAKDVRLKAVRNFTCGDEPWEREVAEWIKGPVVEDMHQYGCEVWLYYTRRSGRPELVGYGSLGEPPWIYPKPGEKRPSIIPSVGIQAKFQGQPDGPAEERYSTQILADLILTAQSHTERSPLLVLYVHPQNTRAIRLYERVGFERFHKTYKDKDAGVEYLSMILDLA